MDLKNHRSLYKKEKSEQTFLRRPATKDSMSLFFNIIKDKKTKCRVSLLL